MSRTVSIGAAELTGVLEYPSPFWPDEPESDYPLHVGQDRYQIAAVFLEVTDEDGTVGIGGPIDAEEATLVLHRFAPLVIGGEPFATERLWDLAYRSLGEEKPVRPETLRSSAQPARHRSFASAPPSSMTLLDRLSRGVLE